MKKFLALLLAAALTAMTCVPVLAAGSVSVNGVISGGTSSTGGLTLKNDVTSPTDADIKNAVGNGYTLVDTTDISASGSGPYTITLNVAGVTAGSEGYFLLKVNGTWVKVAATFGNGTMTGTFSSLGAVSIVLKSASTAPKTGGSMAAGTAAALLMIALAGAVAVYRKKAI